MLNECKFIGNLGADPEIRNTQNGSRIANLRLAVTEKWKDKNSGDWKESTEWIPIAIFSQPLVEKAERSLKKGSKIYVSGCWKTRKWTDNSGNDRYTTELVLQPYRGDLIPLDGKPQGDMDAREPSRKPQPSQNRFPGRQTHSQDDDYDLNDTIPF